VKVPGLASLPADPPLAVAGDYTTEVKIDVAADATNVGVESGHHRGIEDSVGNHQCDKGALNVLRRRQNWRAELPAGNQQIGGLEHQPVAAVFESLAAKEASQENKSKALSGTSKLVPFPIPLQGRIFPQPDSQCRSLRGDNFCKTPRRPQGRIPLSGVRSRAELEFFMKLLMQAEKRGQM